MLSGIVGALFATPCYCCAQLQVAKVVAPKKAKLAEAEAQYQEVMVGLKAKQQELQVLTGFVISCCAATTCLHTVQKPQV